MNVQLLILAAFTTGETLSYTLPFFSYVIIIWLTAFVYWILLLYGYWHEKKINQLRSRNSFLHVSQFLYSKLIRVGSTCLAVASCQKEQKRCPSSSYPLATLISFPFAEVDGQRQPAKTLLKSEITWKVSLLNSSIVRHNYHYITVTVTATYRKLWVVLKTCNRTP